MLLFCIPPFWSDFARYTPPPVLGLTVTKPSASVFGSNTMWEPASGARALACLVTTLAGSAAALVSLNTSPDTPTSDIEGVSLKCPSPPASY